MNKPGGKPCGPNACRVPIWPIRERHNRITESLAFGPRTSYEPFLKIYITFKPRVSFQLQIFHKTCLACNVYKYVLGFYYLRDHFRAQGARSFSVQEVSIRRGIHALPLRVLWTGLSSVTRDKPENGFRTTILKYAIKEKSALELHLNAGQINK